MRGLSQDLSINLAHEPTYLEFLRNPSELEERLAAHVKIQTVFIDEVQRLPSLLNTIQTILDDSNTRYRFLLTGSSARKLRRGHANLLPGRIHTYQLGPLSCAELNYQLNSKKALSYGTLPGIWVDEDIVSREKTLRSYAATYVKEEVQAENLTRNLEGFSRFLYVAADTSGQFLDFSKMAMRASITRQSAMRFFEVLEDCLIVRRLDAFAKSLSQQLVQHPKFCFFDLGVLNGLLGNFNVSSDRLGALFEQLVTLQLIHTASAKDVDIQLSTYRTEHGAEVDLILEKSQTIWAIEVKAGAQLPRIEQRGFTSFSQYLKKPHREVVLYQGVVRKKIGSIDVIPWQEGIREIFES